MVSRIMLEDLEYIINASFIPWDKLNKCHILVTGATGLICSTVVKAILCANSRYQMNCHVWAMVRDSDKADKVFCEYLQDEHLHFLIGNVEAPLLCDICFQYVIHGASPTASVFFVEKPVETMQTAIMGTMQLLDRARADGTKGFLYLSSMEAYGHVGDERILAEEELGTVSLSQVRSCYPVSKRTCEMLCKAYASEYHVPAMSLRLAQTFGAGVAANDQRVFAMIARCIMQHKNIEFQTKGTSKHPYLYTAQAVTAILCVLLKGEPGETYNAANPNTYCSIYEMGEMAANELASGNIRVVIAQSNETTKYPPAGYLNLSVDKLLQLGWCYDGTLMDMYRRMIADLNSEEVGND